MSDYASVQVQDMHDQLPGGATLTSPNNIDKQTAEATSPEPRPEPDPEIDYRSEYEKIKADYSEKTARAEELQKQVEFVRNMYDTNEAFREVVDVSLGRRQPRQQRAETGKRADPEEVIKQINEYPEETLIAYGRAAAAAELGPVIQQLRSQLGQVVNVVGQLNRSKAEKEYADVLAKVPPSIKEAFMSGRLNLDAVREVAATAGPAAKPEPGRDRDQHGRFVPGTRTGSAPTNGRAKSFEDITAWAMKEAARS